MTTTALSPAATLLPARPFRAVLAGTIVLLAAITVLVVLVLSRTTGSAAPTRSGGHNVDNSNCRPTSVVHYC
jgi:hypothetical protein